jgi:hypothetical protein
MTAANWKTSKPRCSTKNPLPKEKEKRVLPNPDGKRNFWISSCQKNPIDIIPAICYNSVLSIIERLPWLAIA